MFALLVLSFQIVRQLPAQKETILVLPPLVRPMPSRVIDGRLPSPRAAAPTPPFPPGQAPLFAPPPATERDNAILHDLGRTLSECAPEKYVKLTPSARDACPPPAHCRQRTSDTVKFSLRPDDHVKDEARWQREWENENTPYTLPGTSASEHADGHISLFQQAQRYPALFGGTPSRRRPADRNKTGMSSQRCGNSFECPGLARPRRRQAVFIQGPRRHWNAPRRRANLAPRKGEPP